MTEAQIPLSFHSSDVRVVASLEAISFLSSLTVSRLFSIHWCNTSWFSCPVHESTHWSCYSVVVGKLGFVGRAGEGFKRAAGRWFLSSEVYPNFRSHTSVSFSPAFGVLGAGFFFFLFGGVFEFPRVMELEQQQQQLGCGKSAVVVPEGISLREPRLEDLEELSNIAYQTYADYNKSVGIPIEVAFATPQAAWTMLHLFITSSSMIGVVAVEESSGALLGAAFTTTGLLHFLLLFHHPRTHPILLIEEQNSLPIFLHHFLLRS